MTRTRELSYLPQSFLEANSGAIVAPFQFVLDGNDVMRIKSSTSLGGVRLAIQGRRLTADGEIEPFAFEHDCHLASDRQIVTSINTLGAGALLNVAVFVTGAQPVIGEVFALVQIVRGNTGPVVLLGTLLQGYVTSTQGLGWPGSPIGSSMDPAAGALRQFFGTDPGPGATFSETVPPGALWELVSLNVVFAASAAAGTRRVFLSIADSFASYILLTGLTTLAPLDVVRFQWIQGLPLESAVIPSQAVAGLPMNLRLRAGWTISGIVTGMDAADDFSSPALIVREWLEVH